MGVVRIVTSIQPVLLSLLASSVALSADDFDQSIASRPSITVAKNGESATRPEKCRATLVGPGINQPDPFPGYGGFVGWISPVRLKNGDWLIGFSAGYWHASPPTPLRYSPKTLERYHQIGLPTHVVAPTGGRAMIIRSTDAGKTWSKPATLIDTPVDDRHPAFVELRDGTLLCSLFTYTGTEEGEFARHPEEANHTVIVRSFDHGKTWEKAIINPNLAAARRRKRRADGLAEGRLGPIDNRRGPKGGGKSRVALLTSHDRGATWQCSPQSRPTTTCTRPRPPNCPTAAGDDCPAGRRHQLVKRPRPTWTAPVTFGMRMFAPSLYVLRDGTLVCLHGSYAPGNRVAGDLQQGWRPHLDRAGEGPRFSCRPLLWLRQGDGVARWFAVVTYQDAGGHSTRDARACPFVASASAFAPTIPASICFPHPTGEPFLARSTSRKAQSQNSPDCLL